MTYVDWHNRVINIVVTLFIFTVFFTTSTQRAEAQSPQANAIVDLIVAEGDNRYTITGTALDSNGNPACALALASGRCMFTCGPGSLRCEGGTADLPFGRFELNDLALESNDTIALQIFVQDHISYTEIIDVMGVDGSTPDVAGTWKSLVMLVSDTCSQVLGMDVPEGLTGTYELDQDGAILSGTVDGLPTSGSVNGVGDFVLTTEVTSDSAVPSCTITVAVRDEGNFINGNMDETLSAFTSGTGCPMDISCSSFYQGSITQLSSTSALSVPRESNGTSSLSEALNSLLNQLSYE